jgi:ABC-2 type transport system ATP-binding protein
VLVRTPDPARLRELIIGGGGTVVDSDGDGDMSKGVTNDSDTHHGDMIVTGLPAPRIGELAASASIVLHELTPRLPSLEEAFMELTADSVEYGKSSAR